MRCDGAGPVGDCRPCLPAGSHWLVQFANGFPSTSNLQKLRRRRNRYELTAAAGLRYRIAAVYSHSRKSCSFEHLIRPPSPNACMARPGDLKVQHARFRVFSCAGYRILYDTTRPAMRSGAPPSRLYRAAPSPLYSHHRKIIRVSCGLRN